jgi:hypothetical protein
VLQCAGAAQSAAPAKDGIGILGSDTQPFSDKEVIQSLPLLEAGDILCFVQGDAPNSPY